MSRMSHNYFWKKQKEILDNCEITPALMQVEAHLYYPQAELRDFLSKERIATQACILGGRDNKAILKESVIEDLAQKCHKSPAQILLRWHTQMNIIVIPGSKTESHTKENINIFDYTSSDEDMTKIATVDKKQPFYGCNKETLKQFTTWRLDVERQE